MVENKSKEAQTFKNAPILNVDIFESIVDTNNMRGVLCVRMHYFIFDLLNTYIASYLSKINII